MGEWSIDDEAVAQSFPLLETPRPFLREEPQSLKDETLVAPG